MSNLRRVLVSGGLIVVALGLSLMPHAWLGAGVTVLLLCISVALSAAWFLPALPGELGRAAHAFRTKAAPHGIISLELAGNGERAAAIVQSWRERSEDGSDPRRNVLADVTTATGKDLLLVAAYLLAFVCAITWSLSVLRNEGWGWFWLRDARFALSLGAAVLVAGILDVLENVFMLRMIAGAFVTDRLPAWTRRIAVAKFAFLALATVYAGLGLFTAVASPA